MAKYLYFIPQGNTNQAPDKLQKLFENSKKVAVHTQEKDHTNASQTIFLDQASLHSAHEAQANYLHREPIIQ